MGCKYDNCADCTTDDCGGQLFRDWYITNDVNDEAWGLLQCTFNQACCWAVNHLDMSWEWHVTDPKEDSNGRST